MIAQVTDWAESIGAVRMRSPLSRRSRLNVLTVPAMLPRPIVPAVDEADGLPVSVDRRALVVDEAGGKTDLLHRLEIEVGFDLGRLLRPGDPEAVGRPERLLQGRKATLELFEACREEHQHLHAGLRAQLLAQRRPRVVLVGHQKRCRARVTASVPNSRAATGMRSSAAWTIFRTGKSGGRRIGMKPYVWIPSCAKNRPSVTPP